MKKPLFTGSGVAIVTPFTKETVDLPTLGKLLDFQMKNGTDAIIVCGTTGEASTMSYRERMRTIEFCVDHVDGRLPVIAGTGSNSTENALALSRDAERAGADGLLLVTPYYNKASQAGLIRLPHRRHHRAGDVCGACQAPQHQRRQGGGGQFLQHSEDPEPVPRGLLHLVRQR